MVARATPLVAPRRVAPRTGALPVGLGLRGVLEAETAPPILAVSGALLGLLPRLGAPSVPDVEVSPCPS